MRLQAVSEQLAVNVNDPEGPRRVRESERGLGHVLDEIIEEVDTALREAEPRLADEFQRIVVDPCAVSVVSYTPLRPFVVRMNDTGDLNSLAPRKRRRRRPRSSDAAVGGGAGS